MIDPTDEETGTLEDRIGTDRTDAPSSLSMKNSFEECLWSIRQALRVVMAHREEFEALDLLDGLKAFLSHAHLILDRRDYDARVTASIAKLRGVGERAARRYKRWFRQEMKRQRERSAVVKEVLGALHLVPPDYTLSK